VYSVKATPTRSMVQVYLMQPERTLKLPVTRVKELFRTFFRVNILSSIHNQEHNPQEPLAGRIYEVKMPRL
jgi:hypothetical protein